MNTTKTMTIAILMITAFAFAAPVRAAPEPDVAPIEDLEGATEFNSYLQSCCSKCKDAAKELCRGGKVKNFDCGGWPCECNFDCSTNLMAAVTLLASAV